MIFKDCTLTSVGFEKDIVNDIKKKKKDYEKEKKQTNKKKTQTQNKIKLHSSTRINTTSMQEQMKNIGDGTSPAMTL